MISKLLISGLSALSIISSNVIAIASISDPIIEELSQDSNFNPNDFKFNPKVEDHKEFSPIGLYEHSSNEIIFYVFNVTGFGILHPDDCKLTMSYNSDNEYVKYDLNYLGKSRDDKFYKFKIENFLTDSSINKREYKVSEFEVKQQRVYDKDGNPIGIKGSEIYSSSNISKISIYSPNDYNVQELNTVDIKVKSDYYRVPGSKSKPFNGWDAVQTDVFYIYFNMPKTLGDLISIKMQWTEVYDHYIDNNSGSCGQEKIGLENNGKETILNPIEIKSGDSIKIDENKDWFWKPETWFIGASKGYNLKNLQKFTLSDVNEIESKENNYCLTNETINFIKKSFYNPLSDPYVIRYSVKDFQRKFEDGKHHQIYDNFSDKYIRCNHYKETISKYRMKDIDIITCTFMKNDVAYTLPVVSNTSNQDTSNSVVPNNDLIYKIKLIIGILITVLLVILLFPFLPYLFNFIKFIFISIINFFKKIINLFKKDKKQSKKKK